MTPIDAGVPGRIPAGIGVPGGVSKSLLAPGLVLAARLLDRTGKDLRSAPRDALVAHLAPAPLRGAAFGLRLSPAGSARGGVS